jgi:uncharacterized protein YcaQ
MPHHHGLFGRRVQGGEHRRHLVVERCGRRSVTLTREGEPHGAVAQCLELGHNIVPCGSVEPQAGDEQYLHDQPSFSSGHHDSGPTRDIGSVPRVKVTAEAARRFLVAHHLLGPAHSVRGGPDGVMEVFRRLGSVQFDPLAVAGRNHDLVLHARVADYDPAWTDELLYERRELFEAYNKALCLLPTSELPWYRVSWTQTVNSPRTLADNPEVAEQILDRIRAEGPLTALDFESGRRANWFGTQESIARAVLEAYAATGVLGLARREGNRRYYDLIERLFPAELLAREVPRREQLLHKMLSRFRAHGLPGIGGGEIWGGLGYAKADPRRPGQPSRTELREQLIEEGEVVPVEVEGVRGTRFVLRDEVDLLSAPPEPPPSVAFLAPLDPFVWDRQVLQPLFGFEHVWEVYIPEHKRRWGYYVLTILFRDRLVGRIEPRIDRAGGRVHVLGLWWEEGFAPRRADGFVDAMREALRAYLRFAGANRIEWAPHLRTDKRLFSISPKR